MYLTSSAKDLSANQLAYLLAYAHCVFDSGIYIYLCTITNNNFKLF